MLAYLAFAAVAVVVRKVPEGFTIALGVVTILGAVLTPAVNREGGPALAWTVVAGLVFFSVADYLRSAFVAL